MEVRGLDTRTPGGGDRPIGLATRPGALTGERVGVSLGAWQAGELRLARSFPACRGLGHEQLEDLYQETALVLLGRSFQSEAHLRHALRWGIKHRALHLHRDERRRGEILSQRAPEMQLAAEARERTPELAALLEEDRLIVSEFLSELSELERRVFWLSAEGLRYRAIAPILEIPLNDARKASRGCERKRERFQLLYDTGRLCGYRAQTILAMQAGEKVTDELAGRAYAHLHACASCRSEHKTNARRLRRSFQGQAAALLPTPLLTGGLSWASRVALRTRLLAHRLPSWSATPGTGVVRERAIAMLASGGAAAKLAASVAAVAVIAGGTIGATRALEHPRTHPEQDAHSHAHRALSFSSSTPGSRLPLAEEVNEAAAPSSEAPRESKRTIPAPPSRREPGGFAFLGVPSASHASAEEPVRATSASAGTAPQESGSAHHAEREQTGGGPFSP